MWSNEEREILKKLDGILQDSGIRAKLEAIANKLRATLDTTPGQRLAKEPVSLDLFGQKLPGDIRACWVYVMRAPSATGAERHANSHQRTVSFQGKGDFQLEKEPVAAEFELKSAEWKSNNLSSDRSMGLESRWISVPPRYWHQAIASEGDWIMVSFHTAAANELIEEHPAKS